MTFFRQFWHHSKPGTAKSTFALNLAISHSPPQTTSIWKFLGLLSVFGFFQKIILISAGQDLIRKNASSLIFRKSSFLSWTTPFLDRKTNTCVELLYSRHVQILLDANDDVSCVIFCYMGKLAYSDFPVATDKHNCDMRRRYETHSIVLRSRGIRRFKLKYVDLQKRKRQIFASQIIVFSLRYWEVRTRMAF